MDRAPPPERGGARAGEGGRGAEWGWGVVAATCARSAPGLLRSALPPGRGTAALRHTSLSESL